LQPLPEKTATQEGHRRYEFDLGSSAPELVKMLEIYKDKDNNPIMAAALDDANACWVTTGKAGGATKNDITPSLPKP